MERNFYERLIGYKSAMLQAQIMFQRELITAEEYGVIETKMCEKYCIDCGSLFRENDWIYSHSRGNMSPTKEVI